MSGQVLRNRANVAVLRRYHACRVCVFLPWESPRAGERIIFVPEVELLLLRHGSQENNVVWWTVSYSMACARLWGVVIDFFVFQAGLAVAVLDSIKTEEVQTWPI